MITKLENKTGGAIAYFALTVFSPEDTEPQSIDMDVQDFVKNFFDRIYINHGLSDFQTIALCGDRSQMEKNFMDLLMAYKDFSGLGDTSPE